MRRPPRIATWLLRHFADPYQRDALLGDLQEEYERGRSAAWYRRQVAVAILAGMISGLRRRSFAIGKLVAWWAFLFWVSLATHSPVPLFLALDLSFYGMASGKLRSKLKR
jgi:hypothetical protein